ncbi:MAG: hypothetical protein GX153_08405 [Clostridiaceae bacterium]|nr:hypothetical protein [Clostridiaceae bacterium]
MGQKSLAVRLSRLSLPIVVLFVALTMTVGLFMSLLFDQESLLRAGRGFYSENAVFFYFPAGRPDLGGKVLTAVDVEGASDYLVVNSVEDIRGVYISGSPETPPMIEGRFLKESDCTGIHPLAVVGTGRWDEVRDSGGIQTIELLGVVHEVIGRMGTEYDSMLNHLVMVGLGSIPEERLAGSRFYVDGDAAVDVFQGIAGKAGALGIGPLESLDPPLEPIDIVAPQLYWGWLYLVVIITIMLLSSAILMVVWINRKIYVIAVYRLVGYDGKRICAAILGTYLILAVSGIGSALVLQGVLSVSGIYVVKTTFVRQSATVAGISFLAGLSVTIPALLRAVRADVVRILR